MIMRRLIIILALLPIMCYAQFEASMFTTNNQKLIEQAVKSGITIIERTYQLEDSTTRQRFGRYGNEIFGKSRSLGIRVGNSIIVDQKILTPWESDVNFDRFRASHIPVIASSHIIELDDTIKKNVVIKEDSVFHVTKSLISLPDSSIVIEGFAIDMFDQPTEGWMVLITSNKTISEWDGTPILYSIYKKNIDFSSDNNEYEVETPQMPNNIWGGVFIIPKQTQIGQLTFTLAGILVKNSDNNWSLETPLIPEERVVQQLDELTPLGEQ